MEDKVITALKEIGYKGPLNEKSCLLSALEEGPKCVEYTNVVSFLTNELKVLCNIDEQVNSITNPEDSITFLLELSSFLKELGCPYKSLTHGHISDRFDNIPDRLLLLNYLSNELMAARILREKRREKTIELKLQESGQAADLRKILMIFGFPKPPANITVQQLFQKLIPAVQNAAQKAGKDLVGNPIFNGYLSDKQWNTLDNVQKDLCNEYTIRREMLLKRLDCTIQSFEWSDKTKGKEEVIEKIYSDKRKLLKVEPEIDLSDMLAARDDIAIIEKTSNANVRKHTQSSINKVIIGQVPDRGGRTSEQAPPPPEMPSWQQRSAGPVGGRGGFRGQQNQGRGRGRGGGGNFNRGDSHASQGTSQTGSYRGFDSAGSYGGGRENYSSGGNDFNMVGNTYNRGANDSNRGAKTYNTSTDYQGRVNTNYGSGNRNYNSGMSNYDSQGGNNYNRAGNNYCSEDLNRSFDSAGSYGGGSGYSKTYSSSSDNYNVRSNNYSQSSNYSESSYDSAGSFGGYKSSSQDYHYNQPKRAKTYDSFQSNKTTYADQYVQDSQHNQQYHPRGNRGGRGGRSNYSRGEGHSYR